MFSFFTIQITLVSNNLHKYDILTLIQCPNDYRKYYPSFIIVFLMESMVRLFIYTTT